jgi:hypothetical protein
MAMTIRTINAKADTLDEAREAVLSQIPEGFTSVSTKVISSGDLGIRIATADTLEAAFEEALSRIPADSKETMREELSVPTNQVIRVEATDESTAAESAMSKIEGVSGNNKIKSIRLVEAGKKGLFGLRAKANLYEVEIVQDAKVRIEFKPMAEISSTITNWEDNPEDGHKVLPILVEELLLIVRTDHEFGRVKGDERAYDRSKYDDKGWHIRACQIGAILHRGGGEDLMRRACLAIYDKAGHALGNSLSHCWKGIGKWMP